MIKAVFFDIDGTLVSFETHQVPASALEALHSLRDQGIKLFLATGRHKSQLTFLEDVFRFDAYITLNGQYCYNDREVFRKQSLAPSDVAAVVEQIRGGLYPCYFIGEERRFINMMDDRILYMTKQTNTTLPEVENPEAALREDIYQLVAYLGRGEEHILMDRAPLSDYTRWHDLFMDVIPKGGCKSEGIKALLQYYSIPREETMAFGDGENDIDMLQYVSLGVAMGNAADVVRQAADYVTDSVDDDGLANALRQFNLLK